MNLTNQKSQKIGSFSTTIRNAKFYTLSLTVIGYLLLALFSLTSCSKDDAPLANEEVVVVVPDELPTIALSSGSDELFYGVVGAPGTGSLQHKVTATAPEGFSHLIISKVVDGVKSEYQTIDTTHPNYVSGSNSFTYDLGYILKEADVDKELYFTAEIVDIKDNSKTLEFAEATVKNPLILVETLFLETRLPIQPDNAAIAQFLQISNDEVKGVNLNTVLDNSISHDIAAVFSISEDAGFHLSSTKAVHNQESVQKIETKKETKFKLVSDDVDFGSYNIYDTFKIEDIINSGDYGQDEQKTTQLGPDKMFGIMTEEGRIAFCKITYFEIINDQVYLTMDVLINQ